MLYITKTTETQRITVPRAYKGQGDCSFYLVNTDTHVVAFDSLVNAELTKTYAELELRFAVAPEYGTYEYRLTQGGEVIGQGVARVGDLFPNTEYYTALQIKQYE